MLTGCFVCAMIAACAHGGDSGGDSGGHSGDSDIANGSTTSGGGGSGEGGGPGFGSSSSGGSAPIESAAFVSGTVLAPEGSIPISGALIYATQDDVAPIPQNVFCDRCVELPASTAYTFSAADGTFSLGVPGTGDWTIVMQKGSFRRLHDTTIVENVDQPLDDAATTLPSKRDPASGAEIPKMAVATVEIGTWDNISNSLAKLGLGTVDGFGDLEPGTESFDVYGPQSPHGEASALLNDYSVLSQYHIVFFPCAVDWPDGYLTDPKVLSNLREFMRAGGRIYATDYSYDILKRAFGEPITWLYDNGSFGSAETSEYDAVATVIDSDMAAWLAAQGIGSFTLESNFTVVDAVQGYQAPDENGKPTMMTPKVWVNAAVPGEGDRPATISYQYGCGRALFSTYHTEPWGLGEAMPQELAMLYTILEVGVCLGDLPPPK
jgi:hypothetical protein